MYTVHAAVYATRFSVAIATAHAARPVKTPHVMERSQPYM